MTNNQYEEFLQHHGIMGMHWGIRRYQPYPKGHKGGKEIGKAERRKKKISKIGARSEKKLKKIASKRDKNAQKAQKLWNKGDKKNYGFLGSEEKAEKYYNKASKIERKNRKLEYKGAKYYRKIQKSFNKNGAKIPKEVKKLGQDFVDFTISTNRTRGLMEDRNRRIKRK